MAYNDAVSIRGMNAMPDGFFEQIYRIVCAIPRGRVASYGQIAALLGQPRAARTVGWALASLSDAQADRVPWHRVVNRAGVITLPRRYAGLQRDLLEAEGVEFDAGGRVDLPRFGWRGLGGAEIAALLAEPELHD
jgi:methylated-DNA-protein-cysteine methyltransferase-like protein